MSDVSVFANRECRLCYGSGEVVDQEMSKDRPYSVKAICQCVTTWRRALANDWALRRFALDRLARKGGA